MAQSLEQINQSLQQLEQQAIKLGEKLHLAHQGYRDVLAQTALEQLIMACFTLCTEAYPEDFLKLSVSERHQLQADIRCIAQKMQQDLRQVPPPNTPIDELMPVSSLTSLPEMLDMPTTAPLEPQENTEGADDVDILAFTAAEDTEDTEAAAAPHPRRQKIEAELKALFSLESLFSQRQAEVPQSAVEQVGFWHERIEAQAHQYLRQVSSEINQLLQKRKVIPDPIPAPILEAAALVEGGESFGKTPHLLRMMLEAREKPPAQSADEAPAQRRQSVRSNPPPTAVLTIVTLQLRVTELEFHDTNLISWRNQIRTLLKELRSITQAYQKQQHRQAIANARIAWRSTWTTD
jgi:hypothetical protein